MPISDRPPAGGGGGGGGGLTRVQARAEIAGALDALIDDDVTVVNGVERRFDFALQQAADAIAGAEIGRRSANLLPSDWVFPAGQRPALLAGELFRLDAGARLDAAFAGSQPEGWLHVRWSTDSIAESDAATFRIPLNVGESPLQFAIPSAIRAAAVDDDDDVYLNFVAEVRTRGRGATGSLVLGDVRMSGTGTHEQEIEQLVDGRVKPVQERVDALAASVSRQIADLEGAALTAGEREALDDLEVVEVPEEEAYAAIWRDGAADAGVWSEPATAAWTPTARTVWVRVPRDNALIGELVARQHDGQGEAQDYPLRGRVVQSGPEGYDARLKLPTMERISLWRTTSSRELRLRQDVDAAVDAVQRIDGHLGADALALLDSVEEGAASPTAAPARTGALGHLTLRRLAVPDAEPHATEALAGGEVIVGLTMPSGTAAGEPALEAYLSDAAAVDLLRTVQAPNGLRYLGAALALHARPAYAASARVPLREPGSADDAFELPMSDSSHAAVASDRRVVVPDGVAAGTQATVDLEEHRNGVTWHTYTATVTVGGDADGETEWVEVWANPAAAGGARLRVGRFGLRYRVGGFRRIEIEWAPDHTGATAEQYALVTSYYTSALQIPAAEAGVDYRAIYSHAAYATAVAVRDDQGEIVLVVRTSLTHGQEWRTGLRSADYGLGAGGQGVLRFGSGTDYREAVRVTAGALVPGDLAGLIDAAARHEIGLGLYSVAAQESRPALQFGQPVQAPAFLVGAQGDAAPASVTAGPGAGPSPRVVRDDNSPTANRFTLDVRAGEQWLWIEMRETADGRVQTFGATLPIAAIPESSPPSGRSAPAGAKLLMLQTHNPSMTTQANAVAAFIWREADSTTVHCQPWGTGVVSGLAVAW